MSPQHHPGAQCAEWREPREPRGEALSAAQPPENGPSASVNSGAPATASAAQGTPIEAIDSAPQPFSTADPAVQASQSRSQAILRLVVYAGETLLESGGEIFRVQDTMERMARSYGEEHFHVYVLTNGLFASVDGAGQLGTTLRFLPQTSTHLGRIMAVNALSRDIAAGKVPLEQAFQRVAQIREMPKTSHIARLMACGVGTAAFAYLFGGTAVDAAAAFFAGLALEPLRIALEGSDVGKFMANLLCAALVALVSLLCAAGLGALGVPCSLDAIIIGGIIPLVPGIALTTGIRDAAGGDYLSGTIRAIDALLVAAAIACGVGFVLTMASMMGVQV